MKELGEPDLKVSGLQVWVHGRQFPDATDVDDGNWLRITAHCGGIGASVWVGGSIIETTDFLIWGKQCAKLLAGKADRAALVTIEPELSAAIHSPDPLGHYKLEVEITPDHLSQHHAFEFEIDQSFLTNLIRQCEQIGRKYPARGVQGV